MKNIVNITYCLMVYLFFENYIIVTLKTNSLDFLFLCFSVFKLIFLFGILFSIIIYSGIYRSRKNIIVVLFVFIFIISDFVIYGNPIQNVINSIQNVYLWFILIALLYFSKIYVNKEQFFILIRIILFLTFVNFLYSLFIKFSFNGDYSTFYFYKLYDSLGMFGPWNHIKNGDVRAYGFFGSSTALSQVLLIPISYVIAAISVKRNKFSLYILMLFLFYFLYIAQIRNPFFAIMLMFCVMPFLFNLKSNIKVVICLLSVYFSSFFILSVFDYFGLGDLSSNARIPMLLRFLNNLLAQPFGYGIGSTGNKIGYEFFYESSLATIYSDLGLVFGTLFFSFFIFLIINFKSKIYSDNFKDKIIARFGMILLVNLIYMTNYSNIFDSVLFIYVIVLYFSFSIFNDSNRSHNRSDI